jgi:hypothetical protein
MILQIFIDRLLHDIDADIIIFVSLIRFRFRCAARFSTALLLVFSRRLQLPLAASAFTAARAAAVAATAAFAERFSAAPRRCRYCRFQATPSRQLFPFLGCLIFFGFFADFQAFSPYFFAASYFSLFIMMLPPYFIADCRRLSLFR